MEKDFDELCFLFYNIKNQLDVMEKMMIYTRDLIEIYMRQGNITDAVLMKVKLKQDLVAFNKIAIDYSSAYSDVIKYGNFFL